MNFSALPELQPLQDLLPQIKPEHAVHQDVGHAFIPQAPLMLESYGQEFAASNDLSAFGMATAGLNAFDHLPQLESELSDDSLGLSRGLLPGQTLMGQQFTAALPPSPASSQQHAQMQQPPVLEPQMEHQQAATQQQQQAAPQQVAANSLKRPSESSGGRVIGNKKAKVSLADSKISLTVAVPLKDAAALVARVEQWAGSFGINVNTTLSR